MWLFRCIYSCNRRYNSYKWCNNTNAAFKNCASCVTHINDEHIDTAENLDITMPMCNLIEYIDNYSGTSGSLWQFKRDESHITNDGNPGNVTTDNSLSFKCIWSVLEKPANDGVLN